MNQSKFEIMKKGLCDRPVISRMFDSPKRISLRKLKGVKSQKL
jgi:hypothetical protein